MRTMAFLIGARREAEAGMYYWRITQFHMPFYTMPPTDPKTDPLLHSHIFVPVDDEASVNWCISWHPTRALSAERACRHARRPEHSHDHLCPGHKRAVW